MTVWFSGRGEAELILDGELDDGKGDEWIVARLEATISSGVGETLERINLGPSRVSTFNIGVEDPTNSEAIACEGTTSTKLAPLLRPSFHCAKIGRHSGVRWMN